MPKPIHYYEVAVNGKGFKSFWADETAQLTVLVLKMMRDGKVVTITPVLKTGN